jgi:ribosomal protein L29
MAGLPTTTELRKMNVDDLRSEVTSVRREAARIRLGVELQKEKNTARLPTLRRHLAQVLTVLQEKSSTNSSSNSSHVSGSSSRAKKSAKPLSKKSKNSIISAQS